VCLSRMGLEAAMRRFDLTPWISRDFVLGHALSLQRSLLERKGQEGAIGVSCSSSTTDPFVCAYIYVHLLLLFSTLPQPSFHPHALDLAHAGSHASSCVFSMLCPRLLRMLPCTLFPKRFLRLGGRRQFLGSSLHQMQQTARVAQHAPKALLGGPRVSSGSNCRRNPDIPEPA
jgi:hypothetical protein